MLFDLDCSLSAYILTRFAYEDPSQDALNKYWYRGHHHETAATATRSRLLSGKHGLMQGVKMRKGVKRHSSYEHPFASHAPQFKTVFQHSKQIRQSIVWPMAFDDQGRRIVGHGDAPSAALLARPFNCSPPLWKALDGNFPGRIG